MMTHGESGYTMVFAARNIVAVLAALLTGFGMVSAQTAPAPSGAALSISAETDRNSVPLNETLNLVVAIEWTGSADRYRFVWPETPGTLNLDISGSRRGARSWVDAAGEHSRQEFTFILRPSRTGAGRVDPISVTYIDMADTTAGARTLITHAISVEITPPEEAGYFGWMDVAFIGGAVVVLGAVVVVVVRLRKKPEPEPDLLEQTNVLDEHIDALKSARAERDIGGFYGEILQLIRLLLARALSVETAGKGPTDLVEMLRKLPEELSTEEDSLRRMLQEIDRRRFAPAQCEDWELDQAQRIIENLILIIVPTRQENPANEAGTAKATGTTEKAGNDRGNI